jgi:hypothetical protein
MKRIYLSLIILATVSLTGCGSVKLLPVNVDSKQSLDGYKYFYITPTGEKSGTTTSIYNAGYGTYGTTHQKSTNPADVISGFLIKRGYIRVAELPGPNLEETLIINYGESGRRRFGIWGSYTLEATLQFLSASTSEILCTVSGEGVGSTEADDIRVAINRCLQAVFEGQ